jgi:hypothetical protein
VSPNDKTASDRSSIDGSSENQVEKKEKKLKLETGQRAELTNNTNQPDRRNPASKASDKTGEATPDTNANPIKNAAEGNTGDSSVNHLSEAERLAESASNEDAPEQTYEFLTIKVAQKYFFDRTFGGALQPLSRNQFFPINTLSGFTYGGRAHSFSPANIQVRYRPLSSLFTDVRMDVGADDGAVRNLTVSGGFEKDKLSFSTGWYLSRRINLDANSFEPGTFPGNQLMTVIQYGDEGKGFYGGTRIGYDFTDQLISETFTSTGRLRNSRSYFGYAFDCCGIQFNYNTFKAGLRNEGAFTFTFTLAGLGSFGSDQFSELGNSGGNNARRKAKRARKAAANDY